MVVAYVYDYGNGYRYRLLDYDYYVLVAQSSLIISATIVGDVEEEGSS